MYAYLSSLYLAMIFPGVIPSMHKGKRVQISYLSMDLYSTLSSPLFLKYQRGKMLSRDITFHSMTIGWNGTQHLGFPLKIYSTSSSMLRLLKPVRYSSFSKCTYTVSPFRCYTMSSQFYHEDTPSDIKNAKVMTITWCNDFISDVNRGYILLLCQHPMGKKSRLCLKSWKRPMVPSVSRNEEVESLEKIVM